MSYWGGAWSEGEGDNPMRYAGGMLGGTWLASLAADLGNGLFDGAWLVMNMENLNLANTFWDKYYRVFANADTEPPRFLEFERWWGGFFLLNRAEIEWITQELFVGNRIWTTRDRAKSGMFDLRDIKSPIILFASMGDNITPPQQAFNWVADVYGSTDEIKARGQTIVGLMHKEAGHLGIFVAGKVAKKEHTQIVSVLKSIEALPPGLYGMQIKETKGGDGKPVYEVEFEELRLEEIVDRLNREKRVDEKPFEAVETLSELNQRVYELLARPFVQAVANDFIAELDRRLHPLRLQRWVYSDLNPWFWWLPDAAETVARQRQPVFSGQPFRRLETLTSDLISAGLSFVRDIRDAVSEALFFQIYGNMFLLHLAEKSEILPKRQPQMQDARQLPFVRDLLSAVGEGGYAEALARADALLVEHGKPIALSKIDLKEELIADYRAFHPDIPREQMRAIRGKQEIIVRYEPETALATLPRLLRKKNDRKRFLTLLDRLQTDKRLAAQGVTPQQRAMVERMRELLAATTEEAGPAGEEVAA